MRARAPTATSPADDRRSSTMDPQRHSKTGLHDARTTSLRRRGQREAAWWAAGQAARQSRDRARRHATLSRTRHSRVFHECCACSAHRPDAMSTAVTFGRFCSRVSVTFSASLVESRLAHTQNTTRSRTYLTPTSMRPAREPALCDAWTRVANGRAGCRTRRESATLDLAAVGIHIARAPLASQAQHVGIERYCSASRRLRGAQPACQRRRAAPAIRAPASQLCASRRGASAQHVPRTSPRPRRRGRLVGARPCPVCRERP